MSQTTHSEQDLKTLAGQAEIAVLESWWSHELRCEAQRVHDPDSPIPDIVPCSTSMLPSEECGVWRTARNAPTAIAPPQSAGE